jgi:hypothetical protein
MVTYRRKIGPRLNILCYFKNVTTVGLESANGVESVSKMIFKVGLALTFATCLFHLTQSRATRLNFYS